MPKLLDISIADINIPGVNPRNKASMTNALLQDLATSIKQFGMKVPIMVRKIEDGYELMAGERRLRASKMLKLDTITAIVHDKIDDAAAYEVTMLENTARKDLTVLEQITQSVTFLDKYNGDVKAVADKLGMTERAVRIRVNTVNLSKKWKTALAKGEDQLTVEHLDLVARLPVNIQDDLLKRREGWRDVFADQAGNVFSVKKINEIINKEYLMTLSKAPWDLDVKIGMHPACNGCKKRTDCQGQQDMWADETDKANVVAQCLDAVCWESKHEVSMLEKIKEAKKEHPGMMVAYDGYQDYDTKEKLKKLDKNIFDVEYSDYKKGKKSDKNAIAIFIVAGKGSGKVNWFVPATTAAKKAAGKQKDAVKTMAVRKATHKGLRLKTVYPKLKKAVEECLEPTDTSLEFAAAVAAVYGTINYEFAFTEQHTDDELVGLLAKGKHTDISFDHGNKNKIEVDIAGALWLRARSRFAEKIPGNPNAEQALRAEEDCKAVAKLVGFDWDNAWKEAIEEKPDPKIWDRLKADGTPK